MTHPDDILSEDMKRRASALMLMHKAVAAPEFARALLLTTPDNLDVRVAVNRLANVIGILDTMADDLAKEAEAQAPKPEPVSALDAMAAEYARKKVPHA